MRWYYAVTRLGSNLQYFMGICINIEYIGKQNKSEGEILSVEYLGMVWNIV